MDTKYTFKPADILFGVAQVVKLLLYDRFL